MRACAKCGKSFTMGGTRKLLRGKHNPTRWTKKKANLQWSRAMGGARRLLCTKCIKTLTRKPARKKVVKK